MIEIPVYVISGFLDAGKSTFIKPMLVSEDFTGANRAKRNMIPPALPGIITSPSNISKTKKT